MRLLSFVVIFFCCHSKEVAACDCELLEVDEAFCRAQWETMKPATTPKGVASKDPVNPRFNVQHIQAFKVVKFGIVQVQVPPDFTKKGLPTELTTPAQTATCGLRLAVGKEYLLSGQFEGNTLTTVLCGQVVPDVDLTKSFEDQLQWSVLPKIMHELLQNGTYAKTKC